VAVVVAVVEVVPVSLPWRVEAHPYSPSLALWRVALAFFPSPLPLFSLRW